MRGRESVIDEKVAVFRNLLDEGGIVLFLALVEAGVFEQRDVAVLHRGDDGRRRVADAIIGEGDLALEMLLQRRQHLTQRLLLDPLALGPAEMGEQDDLCPLAGELVDRRQDAFDAGRVGDAAVLHRHIQIDAQQHAFAFDVDVVEGAEGGHARLQ